MKTKIIEAWHQLCFLVVWHLKIKKNKWDLQKLNIFEYFYTILQR